MQYYYRSILGVLSKKTEKMHRFTVMQIDYIIKPPSTHVLTQMFRHTRTQMIGQFRVREVPILERDVGRLWMQRLLAVQLVRLDKPIFARIPPRG